MIREKTYIEPLIKVIDDRFEAENLSEYRLFLLLGPIRLHFCVISSESNRCLALESYATELDQNSIQYLEKITQIIDEHVFLPAKFWKSIHVCVANDKFTLIPSSLFREENALSYLQLNCELDPETNFITHFEHRQAGITNVFAFDQRIFDWAKAFYPSRNVHFVHHTSPLIEAILRQNVQGSQSLLVSLGIEYMCVLVKEGEGLKFCNKFFFKTDEDFLYYFFLVVDELGLAQNTPIIVYGEANNKSSKYLLLKKYYPNLQFGHRPKTIHFGYVFDEISEHNYFDLFSMCYCL